MIGYIWARESNVYDKEKYSIKSQLDALRAAAKADGVEVTPEREFEVQFSGRDLWAIPELTALRETIARTDGPKRIYCYSQDRLVRGEEGPEIFWLLFELRRYAAEVVILKNPVDLKNIAGQIMTLVAGHEAAGEIGKIKDRTMRGKKKRVTEGKLWGLGRDKFGYRKDRERGIAEIDDAEADTVRRIFREVLDGKGLMTVARDLNRAGIPTSFTARGELKAQWHPATVRVLLRDPAYKGEVWAFRYAENGETHRMPDNLFPPIVDPETWREAQERLDTNRGAKARNEKQPALLRGLIFCEKCGRPMYYVRHVEKLKNGSKRHRFYYRCASDFLKRHEPSSGKCGGKSSRADWVEAEVWRRVVWMVNNPDAFLTALDLSRVHGVAEQLRSRLRAVNRQIEQKETEQGRLARRLRQTDGRVAKLIENEIVKIELERERLNEEVVKLGLDLAAQQFLRVQVEQVHAVCQRLAEMARADASFGEKRQALEELRITVESHGGVCNVKTCGFLSGAELVFNKTYTVLASAQ